MSKRLKDGVLVAFFAIWIAGLFLLGIIMPDKEISLSERRKLSKFPEISAESLSTGKFMSAFETYSADQFPFRESFRRLKAIGEYYVFNQSDSNGIYLSGGFATKLDYPLDEASIDYAAGRIKFIYENFLKDHAKGVYLSIIPDKNYFLKDTGAPTLDYDRLVALMRERTDFAGYIDIFPSLSLEDYYKTDTHWRIEKIAGAAKCLAKGLGTEISEDYEIKPVDTEFYGVLCGQSSLPMRAEKMYYISSPAIDNAAVLNAETGKYQGVYDFEKAGGMDPYEIYLSGPRSLMTIENPASDGGTLIIFRDSFGSSVAPYLIGSYQKIILVDTRYLAAPMLPRFVDFDGADVLFMYSTMILNSSETMT